MDIVPVESSTDDGVFLNVGEGLMIPAVLTATVQGWGDADDRSTVTLTARWDRASFTYEVIRLTYEAADGRAITGTKLRELPVATMLKEMTAQAVIRGESVNDEPTKYRYSIASGEIPPNADLVATGSREGPTPEVLAHVALIQKYARIMQDPPTKAVADAFQIPHRTASHWVKLARERGHLTD